VKKTINTISGILFFVAFLPYIWAIINHQTVPSPVSWAIWASVDTLALLAMRKEKAPIGQITGAISGAWIVTALAIFFGKPTMGSIEWVSIVGAVTGVILWQKTNNAVLAIVCSALSAFIGSFPTFANGYTNPSQENPLAWSVWFVSCVFALFAIKKWNLAKALQPLTFTTIETTMVVLVVIRPHLLS
jgi:hypothetical protein